MDTEWISRHITGVEMQKAPPWITLRENPLLYICRDIPSKPKDNSLFAELVFDEDYEYSIEDMKHIDVTLVKWRKQR